MMIEDFLEFLGKYTEEIKKIYKKTKEEKVMNEVFLTSEPITLLVLTIITVILIIVGRKTEKPVFPILIVIATIGLLIYHSVNLSGLDTITASPIYFSIAADMILLFLGYISYLWIDDMAAKNRNLKTYGDSLSWFWEKI